VKDLGKEDKPIIRKSPSPLPEKFVTLKKELSEQLGTKVDIKKNTKGKGSIVIPFKSEKELEDIISRLEK